MLLDQEQFAVMVSYTHGQQSMADLQTAVNCIVRSKVAQAGYLGQHMFDQRNA